ncbi:MAG TPA: hypothetical protein DCS07_07100 [Bdellovibrionales bacterium]|nr:MAG: hypothetical protein A2Z97_07060 [Bdellovibrionales bacterium GWB1_52_6]OFZ06281.1 MAG: hypothetical protein A2X97_02345 [Bdellovibrionales bacterium GWA1_52_35]OFZ36128.1 MAG: hypothetical protein A2070_04350 [Bdellovibrionales bacterium GWC1_52_8]HAR42386.1 hypothetical protein [Bdellovibrionales bacterium]HCM40030.1 hypothetical protein [Bdellovibrionales bacterium]
MRPGARLICIPLLLLAAGLTPACSLDKGSKKVIKECVLPADQTGTLSGHWRTTAIPIALQAGAFSAQEIGIITSAADTWNSFYSESLGMAAIDYGGNAASPRTSSAARPARLCEQGIVNGTTFTGSVVIYKSGAWPYSTMQDVIALTPFCSVPASPIPIIFNAMVELNYQNFFIAGKRIPDLKSILVHEFGHLMGLNHSCEKTTKTGFPNCTNASIDPNYLSASLFPVFSFDSSGYGESRQALNDNDQGRANCLYTSPASTN